MCADYAFSLCGTATCAFACSLSGDFFLLCCSAIGTPCTPRSPRATHGQVIYLLVI